MITTVVLYVHFFISSLGYESTSGGRRRGISCDSYTSFQGHQYQDCQRTDIKKNYRSGQKWKINAIEFRSLAALVWSTPLRPTYSNNCSYFNPIIESIITLLLMRLLYKVSASCRTTISTMTCCWSFSKQKHKRISTLPKSIGLFIIWSI